MSEGDSQYTNLSDDEIFLFNASKPLTLLIIGAPCQTTSTICQALT